MNDIAKVMNLQANFQHVYRLHRGDSNQARNAIVVDYHRRLLPILREDHVDLNRKEPGDTIGFAKYFNEVLQEIPKGPADENYHRLMYICDVVLMDATNQVETFEYPIRDDERDSDECTKSMIEALQAFNHYRAREERQGRYYHFLSFSVYNTSGKVIIRYIPDDSSTPDKISEVGDSHAR